MGKKADLKVPDAPENILDIFKYAAQRWPDRPYIEICNDRAYTFGEVDTLSNAYAHGLAALGVEKGDSVCTMMDNTIEHIVTLLGTIKLGAISVPMNTALKGEFLRHQLSEAKAKIVLVESDLADRVANVRGTLSLLRTVVYRGQEPEAVPGVDLVSIGDVRSENETPLEVTVKPEDLCLLLFTSGTTGPSKGCMISHAFMSVFSRSFTYVGGVEPDDGIYLSLPLFHIFLIGGILGSLHSGARLIIDMRFSLSGFWPAVQRYKATIIGLIGAMFMLVGDAEDNEPSKACYGQIRRVIGSAFSVESIERWKERFGVTYSRNTGYGMTEVGLAIITPPDVLNPPPGSTGKCSPLMDIKIVDDEGKECPPGEVGEVLIRGLRPNVIFAGYFGQPELTHRATKEGWFHTGDIGKFDAEGWFYFVDRKKDVIRRRGENVSAYEIEMTISGHPDVAEVAVHAVPSELGEDDVKATLVLKLGATLTEEQLFLWLHDRVPFFALPRYIEFRGSLPRNDSGRVLKFELRDQNMAGIWDSQRSGPKFERRR